jgi:prepilin-type N-terminal cleavage/methylation domain-containing protein
MTTSCYKHPPPVVARRAAFTLIEMLLVVMVISILFGILLSAIRTVERHTLQTVTRGEIKNIENAWKQYFAHYQMWPTNQPDQQLINDEIALALQGIIPDDVNPYSTLNPDRVVFMEFSRFNADGTPLNAWGESGRHNKDACSYYVAFDIDGDNQLKLVEDKIQALPNNWPPPFTNSVLPRGVIVWSYNPAADNKVLGSWQQ